MKTIDFYPTEFHAIHQDNPAFGDEECLMIVGEANTRGSSSFAVVLHIVPDPVESVTKLAKFWRHEMAVQFCETFVSPHEARNTARLRSIWIEEDYTRPETGARSSIRMNWDNDRHHRITIVGNSPEAVAGALSQAGALVRREKEQGFL